MRIAFCGASFVLMVGLASPAGAQQAEPRVSVESLRTGLQKSPQPSITIPTMPWIASNPRRLGMLTLVAPDTNGEIVKVRVPIGDLVSRAAHGVSNARRRRAERHAREEVSRALRDFEARRPTK